MLKKIISVNRVWTIKARDAIVQLHVEAYMLDM